jgi:alkylhydroperoxidase/carboxymuconolactone decarboxylase family protein YurZ
MARRPRGGWLVLDTSDPAAFEGGVPMSEIAPEPAATLRGLAAGDPAVLEGMLDRSFHDLEESGLEPRAQALVRIAALVALDAPSASYHPLVSRALGWGATIEDVVGVLVAVAPEVGTARTVAAAGQVFAALQAAPGRQGGPAT